MLHSYPFLLIHVRRILRENLTKVLQRLFVFKIEILDVYHALEDLKPLIMGLEMKENTKEWKYRHHY